MGVGWAAVRGSPFVGRRSWVAVRGPPFVGRRSWAAVRRLQIGRDRCSVGGPGRRRSASAERVVDLDIGPQRPGLRGAENGQ